MPEFPHAADDLTRLQAEYGERARRLSSRDTYSPFNPAHLFMIQSRQRATLKLLRQLGFSSLADKRILEVGCGDGNVLREYLGYGALLADLHGVDLLPDRLAEARIRLPPLPLAQADGQRLPYSSGSFDLVLQYTAFSSILDGELRAKMAREMLRVLRQPDGLIVWYDFWVNPTNRHARGIRPAEIRRLFPSCSFLFRRITLAPPLTRQLVRLSWHLCGFLESLKVINTHYLVAIQLETAH